MTTTKQTKTRKMPCGCQYRQLTRRDGKQCCEGRVRLATPLNERVKGTRGSGRCEGTAYMVMLSGDLEGATLCRNCEGAHLCEHAPSVNRIHPSRWESLSPAKLGAGVQPAVTVDMWVCGFCGATLKKQTEAHLIMSHFQTHMDVHYNRTEAQ